MSLESSCEHAEPEPPRPATSAETDRSPVVQEDNEGGQPPTDAVSEREALFSYQEQAIHRASVMNEAGIAAWQQYQDRGQIADLNQAVECWQESLKLTPPDAPSRSVYVINLGFGLQKRYDLSSNPADLDAAISAYQQAVQTTPANSPNQPMYLHDLGFGLQERYDLSGNLADLEAAISAYQQAILATSPDSPNLPMRLNNLGNGLCNRYNRTGKLTDLEAAISAYQQAILATSPDSPNLPMRLSNLGNGLRNRYNRTGEQTDLEAAISAYQQAVLISPLGSPNRPAYLNNLGSGLLGRYSRTGELADLEAAIDTYQQAVLVSPLDSPDRPMYLNNLSTVLRDRYNRTREQTDLEAAIDTYQQAVLVSPLDSPNLPERLNNLGKGLGDRYNRTGEQTDLEAAITAWEKSWSTSHPRFAALPVNYQLGQQRQEAGLAVLLVTAYREQARRSPLRSPNSLRRALEIAEGSKSRLLTQLMGRGPLPLPTGLPQEIAAQEHQLLANLVALDTQELASHDHLPHIQEEKGHLQRLKQRQTTLSELESLWTNIASVGSEGTAYVALRRGTSTTWQDLVLLTKTFGPATALLSFFMTTNRVLLFLIRAGWDAPCMVEVPLNQVDWANLVERYFREIHLYRPNLRRGETWSQPLYPLLIKVQQYLGGVERLILAPSGNGHLLPWGVLAERAGLQTSTGQPLPLVTQPALSILFSLRQQPQVSPGPVLIVGNPGGDLPYAEVEANEVAERFGTRPLLGAAAAKSNVLARLPDATLIHLATHASFNANNPLESGIVLADGVLTAREVLQHRLQADLLVLSACSSGQVGSLGGEELAGLSQAFLQAGVRSLLVSLWQVNDLATAALIQAFYTARQAGADKALALRQAMTQIQRDPRWTHPYYWGAFVLLGDWD